MKKIAKTHTFRLTDEDKILFDFLEQIPPRKKSEVLRKMLLFSLDFMGKNTNEKEVQETNVNLDLTLDVLDEIKSISINNKKLNEEILGALKELKNNPVMVEQVKDEIITEKNDDDSNTDDDSEINSIDNMLRAFNVEL